MVEMVSSDVVSEPNQGSYQHMQPFRDSVIKLKNGQRVEARVWGDITQSKFRILALHGWLDNAGSFDSLASFLVNRGCYIVCIDFIGHGRSEQQNKTLEISFYLFILEVIDTIEALGWNNLDLMGHSMGGGIATFVASLIPKKVRKLILFDSIGLLSSSLSVFDQLDRAIRDRESILNRSPKIYASIDKCISKLLSNNENIAPHTARAIVERGTHFTNRGVQFSHNPKLLGAFFQVYHESDVVDILKKIQCPTLTFWSTGTLVKYNVLDECALSQKQELVAGSNIRYNEDDHLQMGSNRIRKRIQAIKDIKMVVIEGFHHVHSDNPERLVDHIMAFLLPKAKL